MILIIEEKRSLVEEQVAHILFNTDKKPILSGKNDGLTKEILVPEIAELSSDIIADVLLKKIKVKDKGPKDKRRHKLSDCQTVSAVCIKVM